ncbi:hypothetical protein NM688_g6864 [Phlebia brevispora]|uniref:Uncharacterized protein n=1 Tax=Phlebia brevispora TaxID=194682 RepID=A0ACC1SBK4_9APHY|nr:hypothetical protein NM688_g6864 [Phlebia brevispora]
MKFRNGPRVCRWLSHRRLPRRRLHEVSAEPSFPISSICPASAHRPSFYHYCSTAFSYGAEAAEGDSPGRVVFRMTSHNSEASIPEDEDRTVTEPSEKPDTESPTPENKETYTGNQTPEDQFQVTLDAEDDPKQWSLAKKWFIVMVVCSGALCGTCASSMASFAEAGISRDLHVSEEVAILGISLFVLGLGMGPLLVGPLSEVEGRSPIYIVSFLLFFAFSWPVTFAPDIAVYLIFRFITGFCSAAFLSVSGGSVSDVFDNASVAMPMAVYTLHPFMGPAAGPLLSGFINENINNWRWTFRVIQIWTFVECILIVFFMPETYAPAILKRKAQKLRKSTGDSRYWSPLEREQRNLFHAIVMSCYIPFKLMTLDGMAFLLNLWAALILGIQYLTFQAFPIIFEKGHHFSVQDTGMTFIGMGLGLAIGLAIQPLFIRYQRKQALKYNGNPPPETRLIPGQVGAILIPCSLYWLAFTTYPHVHWIVPIIASALFGIGILFCFTSMFTYLVTAYRPIAASAMAANTFTRCASAAGFPLFARQMYDRLGTVGATALLAGLTTLAAPLPFVFYKIGARLRARSRRAQLSAGIEERASDFIRVLVASSITLTRKMFSFASFPVSRNEGAYEYGSTRHPEVEEEDEDYMDLDFEEEDLASGSKLTYPGESITSSHAFMRGHGTYVENDEVIASVAGTIERVNKLISVRAVRTRYNPEVGDLVVGRITEVQPRRWKVDAGSRQDAVLMLSSVNLPGGVQRRKLESDELQMRTFFEEGDLLVAEVQAFFADGAMSLHTRSLRYGKLRNGQLVIVPSALIRRLKSHFIALPCGVDLILGLNGYIWVSKHVKESEQEGEEGFDAEAVYSNKNDPIDEATREAVSRVSNIIRVLAARFTPLSDAILLEAYEWAVEQEFSVKDLLHEDVGDALVAALGSR